VLICIFLGRCVLRGCVPKKILVYGANFSGEFQVRPHLQLLLVWADPKFKCHILQVSCELTFDILCSYNKWF
jgi:pyruvate/2-oxoglutarate dehydrogenase complex dihydrolipoamide dehydrogenase (E3) component